MTSEEFKHDYDLAKLKVVVPHKREFEMLVTPRFVSVYGDGAFEGFTADLLLGLAQETVLFIDIGAHYGFYTLLVGTRQGNCRIIAFEPVPENYEILRRNVELNNLQDVELHNLALSDKTETRELNVTEGSDCCSFYEHPLAKSIKKIQVSALALDDFLQNIPRDAIAVKVDVEGHEVSVLEGMKRTLREADDIAVFSEFNPKCLRKAGHQPDDLLRVIDRLGFDIYFIDDEHRRTLRLAGDDLGNWGDYLGDEDRANILCRRKGQSLSVCFFSHSSDLETADRGPRAGCSADASHGAAVEGPLDPHTPVRHTRLGAAQHDGRMRICYVSRECSPYTTGGIGTYISNVLRAMSQAGHEVTLVSDFLDNPRKDRARAELEREGISVVIPDRLPDDLASSYYHSNHEYADRVYQALRRICSQQPLDVIEFPEYSAEGFTCIRAKRLLGEFLDTTLVVKCHTPTSLLLEINNQQRLTEGHVYAVYMEDYCVLHADVVTSPSQSLARYYKKRLGLDDIAGSPYPLTLPPIAPVASSGPERSIAFVGRLEWRKGIDLAVRALVPLLRAHSDVVLDCYGGDTPTGPFETSMLEYLTRRCIPKDVASRVRFHGVLQYDQVMSRMAGASVCVFPSRWEAVGYVCLEAMSMGLPVVVSENGGMGELIEDGKSGFVVDPEDPEALADRVQSVLRDTDLADALGEQAKGRAYRLCDYTSCAREIERSYTSVKGGTKFSYISGLETRPRVSVIIPFYNQGEWLEEAVESALQSNYGNMEVIIVNDGSTDPASNAVFDRLEDRRLKKISEGNAGPAGALNAGIAVATGDLILPLDADDIIHPEYIPVAVQALLNNPRLAYVTCYVEFTGQHRGHWVPIGFVRDVLLLGNPAAVACSLFRREALDQIGGYDEFMICAQDWDLLVHLATTSWDGDVLPRRYFFYRRHADSLTDQYRLPNLPSLLQYMARKYSNVVREQCDELLVIAAGSHGELRRAKQLIEKQDDAIRIAATDLVYQLVNAVRSYASDANGEPDRARMARYLDVVDVILVEAAERLSPEHAEIFRAAGGELHYKAMVWCLDTARTAWDAVQDDTMQEALLGAIGIAPDDVPWQVANALRDYASDAQGRPDEAATARYLNIVDQLFSQALEELPAGHRGTISAAREALHHNAMVWYLGTAQSAWDAGRDDTMQEALLGAIRIAPAEVPWQVVNALRDCASDAQGHPDAAGLARYLNIVDAVLGQAMEQVPKEHKQTLDATREDLHYKTTVWLLETGRAGWDAAEDDAMQEALLRAIRIGPSDVPWQVANALRDYASDAQGHPDDAAIARYLNIVDAVFAEAMEQAPHEHKDTLDAARRDVTYKAMIWYLDTARAAWDARRDDAMQEALLRAIRIGPSDVPWQVANALRDYASDAQGHPEEGAVGRYLNIADAVFAEAIEQLPKEHKQSLDAARADLHYKTTVWLLETARAAWDARQDDTMQEALLGAIGIAPDDVPWQVANALRDYASDAQGRPDKAATARYLDIVDALFAQALEELRPGHQGTLSAAREGLHQNAMAWYLDTARAAWDARHDDTMQIALLEAIRIAPAEVPWQLVNALPDYASDAEGHPDADAMARYVNIVDAVLTEAMEQVPHEHKETLDAVRRDLTYKAMIWYLDTARAAWDAGEDDAMQEALLGAIRVGPSDMPWQLVNALPDYASDPEGVPDQAFVARYLDVLEAVFAHATEQVPEAGKEILRAAREGLQYKALVWCLESVCDEPQPAAHQAVVNVLLQAIRIDEEATAWWIAEFLSQASVDGAGQPRPAALKEIAKTVERVFTVAADQASGDEAEAVSATWEKVQTRTAVQDGR